jgi:acyl carrier protein phosphodiesterase
MRFTFSILLSLLLGTFAWAQDDPELKALQDQLAAVQSEQQAVHQQFSLTQGIRDQVVRDHQQSSTGGSIYAPIQNYDDVQRQTRERSERVQQYDESLRALYARYGELNQQKAAIYDAMLRLRESRRPQ